MILEEILKSINYNYPLKEVKIGLHWTAVVSKYCGLASTMIKECCSDDEIIVDDKTIEEIAQWALSENITKASVGLAAINSLIDVDKSKCKEINASDIIIEKGKDKNISVIGHFPFVDELKNTAKNLWMMEKFPRTGDFPEQDAQKYLPVSDVIAISGTTLVNHTLERLLSMCSPRSIKILLGPTTPLEPILFDFGIDYISGCIVIDSEIVLKLISRGANFRQIKNTGKVKLLTMAKGG
jgi:hypothetical protein